MFFKSLINTLSSTYSSLNDSGLNNVNPNLIKYFRTEYGANWKIALQHHIYKESEKNDKKAA
jgi:hypothetical protein